MSYSITNDVQEWIGRNYKEPKEREKTQEPDDKTEEQKDSRMHLGYPKEKRELLTELLTKVKIDNYNIILKVQNLSTRPVRNDSSNSKIRSPFPALLYPFAPHPWRFLSNNFSVTNVD